MGSCPDTDIDPKKLLEWECKFSYVHFMKWLFLYTESRSIWNLEFWFMRREENWANRSPVVR